MGCDIGVLVLSVCASSQSATDGLPALDAVLHPHFITPAPAVAWFKPVLLD
jgi:hypothetical protein